MAQQELGSKVRAALEERQFTSVAAAGFQAPGVIVSYTDDPNLQTGKRMVSQGVQIAAGVPLQCDEGDDFRSFRIGLFGLDKLGDVDGTVARLTDAFDQIRIGATSKAVSLCLAVKDVGCELAPETVVRINRRSSPAWGNRGVLNA